MSIRGFSIPNEAEWEGFRRHVRFLVSVNEKEFDARRVLFVALIDGPDERERIERVVKANLLWVCVWGDERFREVKRAKRRLQDVLESLGDVRFS